VRLPGRPPAGVVQRPDRAAGRGVGLAALHERRVADARGAPAPGRRRSLGRRRQAEGEALPAASAATPTWRRW
jgi:hypothetical protein